MDIVAFFLARQARLLAIRSLRLALAMRSDVGISKRRCVNLWATRLDAMRVTCLLANLTRTKQIEYASI